jgi:membrane protein DedA with SNARE-associated domain
MSIEHLISRFGYPALIIGLLLEGETVLVLGAFMAHRGYLNLPLVILIGSLVSFASDQFFFWLGRLKGVQFLEKRPAWLPRVEKAKTMLGRNSDLLFLGVRFMYGMRTVLPFVLGMSRFDPRRFSVFNFIGTFLWAMIFGIAGYLFGNLMELILMDVSKYEHWIVIVFLILGAIIWVYRHYANRVEKGEDHE